MAKSLNPSSLAEYQGLVPSTHEVAHNHPELQLQGLHTLFRPPTALHVWGTDINADKTLIHTEYMFCIFLLRYIEGLEMACWLRVLPIPPEDVGLVPTSHSSQSSAISDFLASGDLESLFSVHMYTCSMWVHMHTQSV